MKSILRIRYKSNSYGDQSLHILCLWREKELIPGPGWVINILTMFCMAHYSSCSVGRKYIAFTTAQRHFTDETRNCRQCVMREKKKKKGRNPDFMPHLQYFLGPWPWV